MDTIQIDNRSPGEAILTTAWKGVAHCHLVDEYAKDDGFRKLQEILPDNSIFSCELSLNGAISPSLKTPVPTVV